MGVALLENKIIVIGTMLGDFNYKFKASCANLRWKFKAQYISSEFFAIEFFAKELVFI